jgi:hypothetical protein
MASFGRTAWSVAFQRPAAWALVTVAVIAALLLPAIYNRFPIIFPDTGAYLKVAYGGYWTIDRSGFYGLLYQPILRPSATVLGLWIVIAVQCAVVAGILLGAARKMAPTASPLAVCELMIATVFLTSLPWHAAQLMPDAFTGVLILCVWLAASRDLGASGTPLLWLLTIILALTHYTHLPLMVAVGLVTIGCMAFTIAWKEAAKRLLALTIAVAAVVSAQVAANGLLLHRWTVSPLGSWFLFARLHEDGLVPRWFDAHCGKDGPKELCAIRHTLPHDSQVLLWAKYSPLHPYIHKERGSPVTWHWADMMGQATSGSIREQPLAFASAVARGAARQFVTFYTLDDLCPSECQAPIPIDQRPNVSARGSRQVQNEMPKAAIRDVHTPIAVVGLLLMPFLFARAWRRRDWTALGLLAAVAAGLVANAAIGGGLSAVNPRYQSRVVWLAPFVTMLLLMRWRLQPSQRDERGQGRESFSIG